MPKLYDFIRDLPCQEHDNDFVVKVTSARDLILCLPQPENMERNPKIIPDVPVRLILSTTEKLPKIIADKVRASKDAAIFNDSSLMGLCLNGRGMPIEIFLHDIIMGRFDPSNNYFEEVFWHEYVHGAEGILPNPDRTYSREIPWSYLVQKQMLETDKELGHDPFKGFKASDDIRTWVEYFRQGTDLQQNVSEIFARAACAYMIKIRDTKHAPEFGDASILISRNRNTDSPSALDRNLKELFTGLGTYSEKAQDVFFEEMPMMMARIHVLYGLPIPE